MRFLETGAFVGLVAPGETVVIAGGVIAGQGTIELLPLIALVGLRDPGRHHELLHRSPARSRLPREARAGVKITHERLEQVESYFDRHGGKTILIGRFIGLVRALAPFIAGSSGLAFRRFIPYSIVGTGLWASIFCVLGFIFWRSFDRVAKIAGQAVFGFGITIAVIVGAVALYRRGRDREVGCSPTSAIRSCARCSPWGAPLYRRVIGPAGAVAPQVRFLWNRVTPGDLGLELTTALAVAGWVSSCSSLYLVELSGDLNPTPLDTELLDLADASNNDVARGRRQGGHAAGSAAHGGQARGRHLGPPGRAAPLAELVVLVGGWR